MLWRIVDTLEMIGSMIAFRGKRECIHFATEYPLRNIEGRGFDLNHNVPFLMNRFHGGEGSNRD